jgi:hypothetical protein
MLFCIQESSVVVAGIISHIIIAQVGVCWRTTSCVASSFSFWLESLFLFVAADKTIRFYVPLGRPLLRLFWLLEEATGEDLEFCKSLGFWI